MGTNFINNINMVEHKIVMAYFVAAISVFHHNDHFCCYNIYLLIACCCINKCVIWLGWLFHGFDVCHFFCLKWPKNKSTGLVLPVGTYGFASVLWDDVSYALQKIIERDFSTMKRQNHVLIAIRRAIFSCGTTLPPRVAIRWGTRPNPECA